jgi:hypothetical protein
MEKFQGNVTHVSNHLGRQWAVISRTLSRHRIDPADYRPGGCAEEGRRPGATHPMTTLDSLSATQRVPTASSLDDDEDDGADGHEDSMMGA